MFDRKRPCSNCPFRKEMGPRFRLTRERLDEIVAAPAFQCHKTVDYDRFEDPYGRQGDHPQQCAGLMAVLLAEGRPNQIMQVATRLGGLDPSTLDGSDAYDCLAEAYAGHGHDDTLTGFKTWRQR